MSAAKRKMLAKKAPEGWDEIEPMIEEFEQQHRDAVTEDHTGKRKNELSWRIHRIHWEKNRFIFDLMYNKKAISKQLFDWLVRHKIADGPLIAKWRKPGYEYLCSMLAIQKNDTNFGTASVCRVPIVQRAPQNQLSPSVRTGCVSCASQDSVNGGPIWWNTPLPEKVKRRLKGAHKDAPPPAEGEADAPAATVSHQEDTPGGTKHTDKAAANTQQAAGSKRAVEDDDDVPDEVKRRAQALRQTM